MWVNPPATTQPWMSLWTSDIWQHSSWNETFYQDFRLHLPPTKKNKKIAEGACATTCAIPQQKTAPLFIPNYSVTSSISQSTYSIEATLMKWKENPAWSIVFYFKYLVRLNCYIPHKINCMGYKILPSGGVV